LTNSSLSEVLPAGMLRNGQDVPIRREDGLWEVFVVIREAVEMVIEDLEQKGCVIERVFNRD